MPSQVDLPPGPKLDRRVAELRGENRCQCPGIQNPTLDAEKCSRCYLKFAPKYSTTWAAGILWDELRESGEWCCLVLDSDYHYVVYAKLTREDDTGGHCEPDISKQGDTVPHAITLAWYAVEMAKEETE